MAKPTGIAALRKADGTWDVDTLTAWWAAAIEPVDGVTPLDRAVVSEADNTELIRALTAVEDRLPAAMRTKLDAIAFPKEARTLGFAGSTRRQTDLTQAQGEQLVDDMRPVLERWLGEPLGIGLSVTVHSRPDVFNRPMVGAMAVVRYFAGTIVGPCLVHVRSNGGPLTGVDQWRRSSVLHELYHCYQYRLLNDGVRSAATPAWVGEGTAAYVGEKLSGGSVYSELWMRLWLDQAAGELTNRSYDAIGLFWLLDDAGVRLKARFDELLQSRAGTAERLNVALGPDPAVANRVRSRWGSNVANQSWGDRWHPVAAAHAPSGARAPGTPFSYTAEGRTVILSSRGTKAGTFTGATNGDLLVVTADAGSHGAVRLPDNTDLELTPGEHRFCLTPQACGPCPDTGADPLGSPATRSAEGTLTIGLMSQGEGHVALQGRRWAAVCGEEPADTEPPPPPDAGKCETRVPKADFRRLTGETYAAAYESSVDQCLFEDADYNLIIDLDVSPLTSPAAKARKNLEDIFVTGPDGGYTPVTRGWYFAAVSPDGRQFIGVHANKQFFCTRRHPRITLTELQNLTRFYLASF